MEAEASDYRTADVTDAEVTRQIIKGYSQARAAMDYRRVGAYLHPDARYIMPANANTSVFSGECHGREVICELMRQSDALIEFYDLKLEGVIVEGNRAAVRWKTLQRNRGTGAAMPVSGCAFITQVDGLITEYVHYCDTATIDALAKR